MTTNRPLCFLGFDSICVRLEGTSEISACPARGPAHTAFQRGPVGPPKHSSWSRAWSPAKTRSPGPDAGRGRRAPSILREPRGARCPAACAINGFNERKWKPGAGDGVGPDIGLGLLRPQAESWRELGAPTGNTVQGLPLQELRGKAWPRSGAQRGKVWPRSGPQQHGEANIHSSCERWGALWGGRKQNTFQGK